MLNTILNITSSRIHFTHAMLLLTTEDLTLEQFTWVPGPEAPSIGWHLWHIARWADRVQTAMPERDGVPRQQLWESEGFIARYALDPTKLGVIGSGEGIAHEDAINLPQAIGQSNIVDYAQRSFSALDAAVGALRPEDLEWVRPNCRPVAINEQRKFVPAPAGESPLYDDLAFHTSHANRHLGMIEALRGTQGFLGTATA